MVSFGTKAAAGQGQRRDVGQRGHGLGKRAGYRLLRWSCPEGSKAAKGGRSPACLFRQWSMLCRSGTKA